jgi:hypothetical protein
MSERFLMPSSRDRYPLVAVQVVVAVPVQDVFVSVNARVPDAEVAELKFPTSEETVVPENVKA